MCICVEPAVYMYLYMCVRQHMYMNMYSGKGTVVWNKITFVNVCTYRNILWYVSSFSDIPLTSS